jgi:cob(I)alamin adenosyltransferase
MAIYTRSGDAGQTSLIYGRRINKDASRVEAYGTVDEANSHIGFAVSLLPKDPQFSDVRVFCARIQRDLFDVGRDLATPDDKRTGFYIGQADVDLLERMIDHLDEGNPPLTRFVLPGGDAAAAAFHVARTVVRRAERLVVATERNEYVQPVVRKYLNRLSDLLFVTARAVNMWTHVEEPGVDFHADKVDPFTTL